MDFSARSLVDSENRADRAEKQLGAYMVGPDHEFTALAHAVEADVFGEVFGDEQHVLQEEYGPYEPASSFIVIVDHTTSDAIGAMRIIRDSPLGLKAIGDFANYPAWNVTVADIEQHHDFRFDSAVTTEVSTIAVRASYRNSASGSLASFALYHGLYRDALVRNEKRWFAVLDDVVLGLLHSLGAPFEAVCGLPSTPYLGSAATTPTTCDIDAVRRGMRDTDRRTMAMILDGVDLHDVVSFPEVILDSVATTNESLIDLRDSADQPSTTTATSE